MDSYNNTLDYLYNHLPVFQRTGPAAYKNSLGNTLELDKLYRHPHRNYKTIHVAGTNGKGSVSHMLAAVLQVAGFKTGLYTSPHLTDFRERIKVNGEMVGKGFVVNWVARFRENNKTLKLEPSFFELTVAMAFDYFSQQDVEIAVIEVGLGGRLDSTNIITPEVSVITNISFDHTALLGNSLEEIAAEKAGIIKKGVPVVVGRSQERACKVFAEKAGLLDAPLFFSDKEYSAGYSLQDFDGKQVLNVRKGSVLVYPGLKCGLAGEYQRENVITTMKVFDVLKEKGVNIPEENIYDGLAGVTKLTGFRGRWQVIGNNPLIICDTGHNPDGVKAVVSQIKNTAFEKLHFIFGAVNDKDIKKILMLLPTYAKYYFTKAKIPRAMDPVELSLMAKSHGLSGEVFLSVAQAFEAAKESAGANDLIFIGGSTFIVAEVL